MTVFLVTNYRGARPMIRHRHHQPWAELRVKNGQVNHPAGIAENEISAGRRQLHLSGKLNRRGGPEIGVTAR